MAICAVICGADNFVTMAEFARSKKQWFESFLDMPKRSLRVSLARKKWLHWMINFAQALWSKGLKCASRVKRSFSCTEELIQTDDNMIALIKISGRELQKELVETLFAEGSILNK